MVEGLWTIARKVAQIEPGSRDFCHDGPARRAPGSLGTSRRGTEGQTSGPMGKLRKMRDSKGWEATAAQRRAKATGTGNPGGSGDGGDGERRVSCLPGLGRKVRRTWGKLQARSVTRMRQAHKSGEGGQKKILERWAATAPPIILELPQYNTIQAQ